MNIKKRYILGPVVAFLLALVVFVFLITASLASTDHHEHVDSQQIVKIEAYIDQQIRKSKGCSATGADASPKLKARCEKTINGIIASIAPFELQAIAKALEPYLNK